MAALLTSREECEFVGVAIPEQMSLEETMKLTGSLERLKVPMRQLLINMVVPQEAAAACDFCASRRNGQEKSIKAFQERFNSVGKMFLAPQQRHEIRGPERLREHFARWQQLSGASLPPANTTTAASGVARQPGKKAKRAAKRRRETAGR